MVKAVTGNRKTDIMHDADKEPVKKESTDSQSTDNEINMLLIIMTHRTIFCNMGLGMSVFLKTIRNMTLYEGEKPHRFLKDF